MKNNFTRVRRRSRFFSFLLAFLTSVGVGVISAAVLIFVFKLKGDALSHYWFIGSIVLTALSAFVLYKIFAPSEKKLAKRLDEEEDLSEKMRTMLALRGSEEVFAVLQREDAEEKLGKKRVRTLRKNQIISALLVMIVSAGCLAGAMLVPAKAETPEPPLDEFDKEWIISDLNEIILIVENSLITDSLKENVVLKLRGLVDFVVEHDLMSEIKAEAVTVVIDTNKELKKVNTAQGIGEALSKSANEDILSLGNGLVSLSGNTVNKALRSLSESIVADSYDRLIAASASDELSVALSNSDSSSALVRTLKNLASAIRNYADFGAADMSVAFADAMGTLTTEVMIQFLNRNTVQTVTSRLCALFGILQSDLDAESDEPIEIEPPAADDDGSEEDGSDKEEPDKDMDSGGLGTGEMIYGSNDMIYDYRTNTYIHFGELLAEYRARANEKVNDGKFEEDFAEFVKSYFRKISESGSENGNK